MNILEEAIIFATQAHSGQMRKLSGIPYILHPMEVASIIATLTDDKEVMAAGMLHDVLEDTKTKPGEISEKFGKRVFALVQSETEDKFSYRPASETWLQRKKESLMVLKITKDINVKRLWLGDKLSNMRSFCRQYEFYGEDMWNSLNQKDPSMHKWYYTSILNCLRPLKNSDAYKEYASLIDKLFSRYPDKEPAETEDIF